MKRIVLIALIVMFLLTGCGAKKELTVSEFEKLISNEGFIVDDATSSRIDKSIKTLLVVKNSKYEMEFHEYENSESAQNAFDGNKTAFQNQAKSKKTETSVNLNSYQKYTLETSDQYNVIIKNGKTLLYASINLQYKKDLNKVIKNIGY